MSRLRVCIQQPALPLYRVPVFQTLSIRGDLDIEVSYNLEPGHPPNVEAPGVVAKPAPLRIIKLGPITFKWQPAMIALASKRRSDVLVLPWDVHYLSLWPALLRCRLSRVRCVLWGHGYSKNEKPIKARVRRLAGRLAHAVLLYGEPAAAALRAKGFPHKKVHVATNTLDQTPIQQAREDWLARPDALAEFQTEHNLAGKQSVIHVSRLLHDNRPDLLIDAVAKLKAQGRSSVAAILVGKGPAQPDLEAQAEQLGLRLGEDVIFPGAIYDDDELAPWMLSAKAMVYPANLGLSILHGYGFKLPCVTGDDLPSHNPEIEALREGETGRRFQDGSASDLARVLGEMLDDPEGTAAMGEAGWVTAVRERTLEHMVDGYEAAVLGSDPVPSCFLMYAER